jgi:hypothetical protein
VTTSTIPSVRWVLWEQSELWLKSERLAPTAQLAMEAEMAALFPGA